MRFVCGLKETYIPSESLFTTYNIQCQGLRLQDAYMLCSITLSLDKTKHNLCQFVDSSFHSILLWYHFQRLTSLVSCSPSPATQPSVTRHYSTVYNGMKIALLLKNKSQTWVKEGGGGHPTWLLLVVQQLVTGLKVLVTVLTAILPLLCRMGGRKINIVWYEVRCMCCTDLDNV